MHYSHRSVRHSVGEYVDGMAYTNGIESFWATLKRAHKGTFHQISPKHMQRYVDEFAGRHNVRRDDTDCPSSDDLGQVSECHNGGSGVMVVDVKRLGVGAPSVVFRRSGF